MTVAQRHLAATTLRKDHSPSGAAIVRSQASPKKLSKCNEMADAIADDELRVVMIAVMPAGTAAKFVDGRLSFATIDLRFLMGLVRDD